MALLEITKGADNPVLRTKSVEVKKIDRKIKRLIQDMIDTMLAVDGLGIAAPQVGVNLRLYVARLNFGTTQELILPMINAEILTMSEELERAEEGCLSLPGKFATVPRAKNLAVRFTDQKGALRTLELEGLNARIIQHETDHINAGLFIDRMEGDFSTRK